VNLTEARPFCSNSYTYVWLSIPHVELDIVFGSAVGHVGQTKPATVLTITISANTSSSPTATVGTLNSLAVDPDKPLTEGGATRPIVQCSNKTTQSTTDSTSLSPSPRNNNLVIDNDTLEQPIAGSQTEMPRTTLCRAEEAINTINTIKTWKSAVNVIKRVMDTVKPIVAVCPISFFPIRHELTSVLQLNPYASLAWRLLSNIPEACPFIWLWAFRVTFRCPPCLQTLLQLVQRGDNIQTLLEAIRDVFELAEQADPLKNIWPASRQAKILDEMLQCVSKSAEFIESYSEDVQVGTSALL
jgi:hypothetical protein